MDLPDALKAIMSERGWSQTDLARELGQSQSWVSQVTRGVLDPSIGKTKRLLESLGWKVDITPKPAGDPVKRREFVTAVASVAFVPSAKVGPYQDFTYVRKLAEHVAAKRYDHGGGAVVAAALRHTRNVESAVSSRDRKLKEAASDLAVETVWTLNDARRFTAGINAGHLALELARRSGSMEARSRALSALAAISIDHGDAERAVAYAKQGTRLPDVPLIQDAFVKLRLSWGLALIRGQEHAARNVIEDIRIRLEDASCTASVSPFDLADITADMGECLNRLGATNDAMSALGEATTLLAGSSPLLQALFRARRVVTALQGPQSALAVDEMLMLARLAPMLESSSLDHYIKKILLLSSRFNDPEILSAKEQLSYGLS